MDGQTEEKEEVPVKGKGKGPLKGKKSVKGKSPSKGKGAGSAKKRVESQSSTEESVVELMEDEKASPRSKTAQISEDFKSDLSENDTAKGSKRKNVKESMITGKKLKTEQTLEKSGTSKEPSAQERLQQRLNQRKKEARQSKRGRKTRPIT